MPSTASIPTPCSFLSSSRPQSHRHAQHGLHVSSQTLRDQTRIIPRTADFLIGTRHLILQLPVTDSFQPPDYRQRSLSTRKQSHNLGTPSLQPRQPPDSPTQGKPPQVPSVLQPQDTEPDPSK
ncbi:uncharacterized protein BDZ99DRAFT_90722 [Mytilinidion resinicola]|uniref:Uncharacterized protein n=1 Tax=Mytilinidion resinicola TaxID=574789 RepID=A0A6A6YE10_9PEZI|nr:uncharacterized protein BDZ99DRAFT_90722 [Mytilinidion resinicola]KAF2807062.1 hypothetical protein BDZ99DRAFT_90722 [Mytilinidion resinicola]